MRIDFDREGILSNLKGLRQRMDQAPPDMSRDDLRSDLIEGIRLANKGELQLAFNIQKDCAREFASRLHTFNDLKVMVGKAREEFSGLPERHQDDMKAFLARVEELLRTNDHEAATEALVLAQVLGRAPDLGMEQTLEALQEMDRNLLAEPPELDVSTARTRYRSAVELFGEERYLGAMLGIEEARQIIRETHRTLETTQRRVRCTEVLLDRMKELGYLDEAMYPARELVAAGEAITTGDLTGAWVLLDDIIDSMEDAAAPRIDNMKPFLKSEFNSLVSNVKQKKENGESIEIPKRRVFRFHTGLNEASTFRQIARLSELLEQTREELLGDEENKGGKSWENRASRARVLLGKDVSQAARSGVDVADTNGILEGLDDNFPGCGEEMAARYLTSARNALVRAIHRHDRLVSDRKELLELLKEHLVEIESLHDEVDLSEPEGAVSRVREFMEESEFDEARALIGRLGPLLEKARDMTPVMEFGFRLDGVPEVGEWFEATIHLRNRGKAAAGDMRVNFEPVGDCEILYRPMDPVEFFPFAREASFPVRMKVVRVGKAARDLPEGGELELEVTASLEFTRNYDSSQLGDRFSFKLGVMLPEELPPPPPEDDLLDA